MIRTKHLLIFFIAMSIFLAGIIVALVTDQEYAEAPKAAELSEVSENYDVRVHQTGRDDSVRDSLISKLGTTQREAESIPVTSEPDVDAREEETVDETNDTASTSLPLPQMSVSVGGVTQEGTPGSSCWNGSCVSVGDVPLPAPLIVSSTTPATVAFDINAATDPDRVHYFVKDSTGTLIASAELTPAERSGRAFSITAPAGIYQLLITGIWEGNDVVNIFALTIE